MSSDECNRMFFLLIVNIGLSYDFVPPGYKQLPEPVLT